ncbi:Lrp/AsnC ligand binding domain-containing protein [Pyrofollis japonicus]|uniref:Lrp/AsnC family transcriptional regulator n=1 Tax=Pyrofollis japonicus TaxID=3060460 RepID=UPI00295C0F64|nr:Lrp/AsnC family transcriptional regulator [Pyrofollis japonicus]BEP16952.1 Lrp/AsnC ligand binding domain-containing protein [Pyrofollis japonicus]
MGEERVLAYLLIVAEVGKEYEIIEKIKEIAKDIGVEVEPSVVYGEYDIVVRIISDSLRKIDKAVTMIRSLPGILRTITLIAA